MKVICPECKAKHYRVDSIVQINVRSRTSPVPTETGITFGVGALSGFSDLNVDTTVKELTCPMCKYTGPVDKWGILLHCLRCQEEITIKDGDVNATVAKHYCRELRNLLHPTCFQSGDIDFCKNICAYSSDCDLFAQVKTKKRKPRRKT